MRTITLSKEVMVSDPCYKVGTWCQHKLSNVLPGEYHCNVEKFEDKYWGNRCSFIIAVHKDFNTEDKLNWRIVNGADIGVDSGCAGIFSMETFRGDDEWYDEVTSLTDNDWGTYENGIVSRSGIGDGGYELRVAKHKGKVIGILVNFLMENLTGKIIEGLRMNHMLGDVCGVCGDDNVDGESCNCKN